MKDLKKLRCKKQFGTWYYKKVMPNVYNDFDAPVYELYNDKKEFVFLCGYYSEMFMYVEYGEDCL